MAKVATEKPLSAVIQERRATPSFEDIPIHSADLEKIIRAGLAAPSAYNLQPWRFVVVRDRERKKQLRAAAFNQAKVEEASAVIVAGGDPLGWKNDIDEVIRMGQQHGHVNDAYAERMRAAVAGFLSKPGQAGGLAPTVDLWVNRHVMIAFTTMMWTAETLGYDTAPMEGFEEDKVKALLKIPDRVRVVAFLGIGRRRGSDKPFGGRFEPGRVVFADEWGRSIEF